MHLPSFQSQSHKNHKNDEEFGDRFKELKNVKEQIDTDGLRQAKYQVLEYKKLPEYSHILVELFYANEAKIKRKKH